MQRISFHGVSWSDGICSRRHPARFVAYETASAPATQTRQLGHRGNTIKHENSDCTPTSGKARPRTMHSPTEEGGRGLWRRTRKRRVEKTVNKKTKLWKVGGAWGKPGAGGATCKARDQPGRGPRAESKVGGAMVLTRWSAP